MRRKTQKSHWEKTQKKTNWNIAVGEKSERNPSVGDSRPPTVGFPTVRDSGRPVGRLLFPTREQSFLWVDRGSRPDPTESKALAISRPHGRPKCTNAL